MNMNKVNSDAFFNQIIENNRGLYENLQNMNANLSEDDINIALLTKLYYSVSQIRMILGISIKRIMESQEKMKVIEKKHANCMLGF